MNPTYLFLSSDFIKNYIMRRQKRKCQIIFNIRADIGQQLNRLRLLKGEPGEIVQMIHIIL